VNTDIHRSRSGFGHRRRSRRNVDRAACGAVGRSRGQLRGTGLQILHAAPYVTHPPPTSGGNAPIRSSPTPTPSPSSRTRGPLSTVTTAEEPVPSPRAASAWAALLVVGMGGADRSADVVIGSTASAVSGRPAPGRRRPRTPSPARNEPADPGRRRQRDDQRGRAELRLRRCPPARRSGRRDQRDLEHRQRPRHTCPDTRATECSIAGGVRRHAAHERLCGSGRSGAPAYRGELAGRAEHDEDGVCLDRCVRVGVGEERAVGAAQGEQQRSGPVADRRVAQGSA